MRRVLALMAIATLLAPPEARAEGEPVPVKPGTLYVVGVAHLDTEWLWTVKETIEQYLPPTFRDSFDQMDRFPEYRFGLEGAWRYMLLREYWPDLYDRLKTYVAAGRWFPYGAAIEGADVHIASPEAMIRQFLYGTRFFRQEFGAAGQDVFLPDCFGFGWALPSVAAHCGLKGFSTQKLRGFWKAAVEPPFDIGWWEGPDGGRILAALQAGNYTANFWPDVTANPDWLQAMDRQEQQTGLRLAYRYFGVGDRGGPLDEGSIQRLVDTVKGDGPIRTISAPSDQLFRDLSPEDGAKLAVHRGELLLTSHGTGSYTSQAAMKRWNRQNELLGLSAETAAAWADRLGALPYPQERLEQAWTRLLAQQFHDDVTGTSIPEVYEDAWNDEGIAANLFAGVLQASVGAAVIASGLDTQAEGVALAAWNPLARDRTDPVEAVVRYAGNPPQHVRVAGPDGAEVPAQVLERGENWLRLLFLATVPGTGLATFDVRPADAAPAIPPQMKATTAGLENGRLRVTFDADGNVAQIRDLATGQDLLSGPITFDLFDEFGFVYPAWEIAWGCLQAGARESVAGPAEVRVVEQGPARVGVEITRNNGGSTFVQTVRLAAGADRAEVDLRIDWRTKATTLKAAFPLATANPLAAYDLGLGVIRRPNATPDLYEVPAQQWADLTLPDGSRGVTIATDSKFGWDKPDDGTLRLTLLHTPMLPDYHHDTNDMGRHRTGFAIHGHAGDWSGSSVDQAARYNQPIRAFQAPRREGTAKTVRLLSLDAPGVDVMGVKKAEDGDGHVVRVREAQGKAQAAVRLAWAGLTEALEINGVEDPVGPATVQDGALVFDLGPFQVRTFRLRAIPPAGSLLADSRPVALDFDQDVVTRHGGLEDGAFDAAGRSYAAEQWPSEIVDGGARFVLGSGDPAARNALACRGQPVALDAKPGDRLYVLAAADGDREVSFRGAGGYEVAIDVQDWNRRIRRWDSRVADGVVVGDGTTLAPAYVQPAPVAALQGHRHRPDGDDVYAHTYLFRHVVDVPEGATAIVLPDDPAVRIFAMSLVNDPADRIVPASELHDGFDPLAVPGRPEILGAAVPLPPADEGGPDEDAVVVTDVPAEVGGDAADEATSPDAPVTTDAGSDAGTDAGGKTGSGGCAAGSGTTPNGLALFLGLGLFLSLSLRSRRGREAASPRPR